MKYLIQLFIEKITSI